MPLTFKFHADQHHVLCLPDVDVIGKLMFIILTIFFFFNFLDCTKSENLCNTDIVDNEYHYDGGYQEDRSILPIISVHIGDIQYNNQTVRLRLGPLECNGSSSYADLPGLLIMYSLRVVWLPHSL